MRWVFGEAVGSLSDSLAGLPEDRPVAMIAGNRPVGLGRLSGALPGSSDGTVAVDETRHPELADHVIVASTHTGLLNSARTAELAASFLLQGRFSR